MSWLYRNCVRRALFTMAPEEIHEITMHLFGWASRYETICDLMSQMFGAPELPVELWGLRFPNPLGLAAGMDKWAEAAPIWPSLGFGHAELGAATWHAQPGNPQPRLFRAIPAEAIINRMGFNNPGAEAIASKLADWRQRGRWPAHPVGMNLGKSKITPLDRAAEDYAASFRTLRPHADFFVVNVSSPNTPNLRQLQDKSALEAIFAALEEVQKTPATGSGASPAERKPILVKVAPDLTFEALDGILDLVEKRNISGIVATNTTITRPPTDDPNLQRIYAETGGLSGRPLRARSTEVIRHLYRQTKGRVPIVGVGGIFTAEDAWEKITSGAALLQLYTSLVYEGPMVTRRIVTGLRERLAAAGLKSLKEAVGINVK
ncbi:MAG TPA: quinone-dependent dihydroorotate dehydrogenase [Bacillota bacterium]|nr:quinone-dependent dihydroorotate dehydrogenase [Bacillota bacterium]